MLSINIISIINSYQWILIKLFKIIKIIIIKIQFYYLSICVTIQVKISIKSSIDFNEKHFNKIHKSYYVYSDRNIF